MGLKMVAALAERFFGEDGAKVLSAAILQHDCGVPAKTEHRRRK